jgi:hypothetical protein
VGGGGAKSYDGEKAWSSINHSILSAYVRLSDTFVMCVTLRSNGTVAKDGLLTFKLI